MNEKRDKLKELQAKALDPQELLAQYQSLLVESNRLDSILANREFNIPQNLSSIKFYNFVNNITNGFSDKAQVNIEFLEQKQEKEFFYHEYKLTGFGYFNEVYNLIFAIEHSKELKKVLALRAMRVYFSPWEAHCFPTAPRGNRGWSRK